MGYNIKSIKQEFKDKGIFYTPPELSLFIKSFLPENIDEIYDPTCGDGALLKVFDNDVKKYGQDIDELQVKKAENNLINFVGASGDTLKNPAFKDKKFKYIVANPPFSIKWEPIADERFNDYPTIPTASRADYAFIMHILHYLKDDGIAVVMNFPGVLYRGGREGILRKFIVDKNWIEKVVHVGGDKFVDTKISTCIIVFNKNKKDNSILFINDETKKERLVSLEEIQNNNYTLSVHTYIQEEKIKKNINPIQLEVSAQKGFLEKMKNELEFSKIVCKFENLDFNLFVNEIQDLLNKYKQGN
jgi:type I restriction enzyme M protein